MTKVQDDIYVQMKIQGSGTLGQNRCTSRRLKGTGKGSDS